MSEQYEPLDLRVGEYASYVHITLTWVFKPWVPFWLKKLIADRQIVDRQILDRVIR